MEVRHLDAAPTSTKKNDICFVKTLNTWCWKSVWVESMFAPLYALYQSIRLFLSGRHSLSIATICRILVVQVCWHNNGRCLSLPLLKPTTSSQQWSLHFVASLSLTGAAMVLSCHNQLVNDDRYRPLRPKRNMQIDLQVTAKPTSFFLCMFWGWYSKAFCISCDSSFTNRAVNSACASKTTPVNMRRMKHLCTNKV
jgi:hypothetical protein